MNAQAGKPKYWAFISYSHRDAGVASTLQRALETYRLPKRLAGTTTKAGVVPAYLKPVFRDRDEMQAGADLKATVREALAQSRHLIVVCSPDAARSPWVNQEIVEFKKLHGENRVLALIAAGEPFASNMPGREADECFPPSLRFALPADGVPEGEALEPIAADLRPQGDGKRLAVLKLVAGMVDVGVDELVRRDAQRRARKLVYVASGAVAGMAVMAVLTVLAVQSRIEAQSQRAQAEDLIEFMLGDLRKKLDPVGRLDVLDSVGEKALGYYAKQDADILDANALGRRSRAMHLIGELRAKQGKLDDALTAFKSAADTTEKLLSRQPADGDRIFDHAQSVYWVGYIAWRRGQAQAAEQAFLRYRELAEKLVRINPNNVDWQLEIAYANENLGVAQLDHWLFADALKSFSAQKEVISHYIQERPALAFELAEADGWIAKVLEATGDYRGALRAQKERLEVLSGIQDSTKNQLVRQRIAQGNYAIAGLLLDLGKAKDAENRERIATTQTDGLVSLDPANLAWLSEAAFQRLGLAETEYLIGKRELAEADLRTAAEQVARLSTNDATHMNWHVNLKGRELALSTHIALAEGRKVSVNSLKNYLASVKQFESGKRPLDSNQANIVADVELALGDLLIAEGRRAEAEDHWRAAADRVRPGSDHQNYAAVTLLARAQFRLGQYSEARALTSRVQDSTYRHPAYVDLVNELTHATGQSASNRKSRED